jgi:hypothetical protein
MTSEVLHGDIHEDASHSTTPWILYTQNGVAVLNRTLNSRFYRDLPPPNCSLFPKLKMKLYVRRFYTVIDTGNIVTA